MQALKMFNQRGGDQNQSQGAFIGTALSEASKVRFFCPKQTGQLII